MANTKSSKAKGRLGQQEVRDAILKAFPHLKPDDVRSTAMGQNGEDIQLSPLARNSLPISVEVKRRKDFATLYNYVDQAKQDGYYEPVVFLRGDRKPWLAVISMEHYLELCQSQKSTMSSD